MFAAGKMAGIRELISLVWINAPAFVRHRFLGTLLLIVIASVLAGLGPLALKFIVDDLASRSVPTLSLLLIGCYVASQFVARVITEIRGFVYARAERRMFRILSERLFGHIMHLPMRFHMDRQTGAIAQSLDNGLQGYQLVLNHLVFAVLPGAVELITAVIVLISLQQPTFLALFVVTIVCFTMSFGLFAMRIAGTAKNASNAHVASTATMTDAVLNYETVKFFAAEQLVQERVTSELSKTEDEWITFYRRYAYNGFRVATIYGTFLAVAVFYAAYEVQQGRMTIGDFILITTYMLQAVRPVEMLGTAMRGLSQGMAMLGKMLELFREHTEPVAGHEKEPLSGPGGLVFDRVSMAYRADRPVLKDISFTLPAGKTIGIVGSSGAGKSTLVRLLVRLIEPDCGQILLDGAPISTLPLAQLRRAIAVVPQDTLLFNDTIGYNIAFGRPGCSQEEIEQAARTAHLHDFILSLPDGYKTRVGERGIKVSGGERQRISIARAALKRPSIYVLDEATSSLDSRTEQEILRNVRQISQSSTTMIIAHRLSTVVHADQIIVLEGCTVRERGTHGELMKFNGAYAALWRAQQSHLDQWLNPVSASRASGDAIQ